MACATAVLAALVRGETIALPLQLIVTFGLVTSLGPIIYRIAYQPLAESSVIVLFMASVGVHFALMGLCLVLFGAEGYRTPAWASSPIFTSWGVSSQSFLIVASSLVLMLAFQLFFGRTIWGAALRASAVSRRGARLVGIDTATSGALSFALAAAVGVLSGLMIAPTTTIYYDTGFVLGLKGFIAAILGGLGSYPFAILGAVAVGLLEVFSSFWASAYKEVLVFTLIIPFLTWRSFSSRHHPQEE